ncbi:HisG-domain-containing protein [Clavulina sp. PMI_390]|nr:HisG-domain-containing protein [Clavulina sp. PMI_390]
MTLLSDSVQGRLLFAIPKKGRLYESCMKLLVGADIKFFRSNRLDVSVVQNHNIALVFLPASDIPRFVGEGNVHLGITGQDQIREAEMTDLVTEVLNLGFGKCALQVQVPEESDIKTVEDLAGKRIATSFECVAGEYFRNVDKTVEEKTGQKLAVPTKIEYVGGSVEASCALGLSDGIVDLVESGETMRAAGLHAIATVLTTEAVLIASKAHASDPSFAPLIQRITSRIAGVIASTKFSLMVYNIKRESLAKAVAVTPGRRAPTVSPLEESGWVAVSVMVETKLLADVMDNLVECGAEDLLVTKLENCRV